MNVSFAGRLARAAGVEVGISCALLVGGSAALLLAVTFHKDSARAPELSAVLATMMTLFGAAAVWLLGAQFAASRRIRDLLLLVAALLLGLTNLWALALPAALGPRAEAYFSWAAVCGQLAVGGILALAAFVPGDRLVVRTAHPAAKAALLVLGGLAVAGLGGLVSGLDTGNANVGSVTNLAQDMAGPLRLLVVLVAIRLLACVAAAFARRRHDEASRAAIMLVGATLLLIAANLGDVITRSHPWGRIGVDAGLRVLAFSLILAAAIMLERRVHRRLSKGAALAERRRVARDLHDGLAQDLAIILAHAPTMAAQMGENHPVVVAARRALAISRSTISELTDPRGATAHESLEAVAQELRDRFAVTIAVYADLETDLEPAAREHVTRIAREAIANAARHGRAQNVVVSLRRAEWGVALRVVDDGCGIVKENGELADDGFGLRSMRERAAALGGDMRVASAPRGGTELEVVLP